MCYDYYNQMEAEVLSPQRAKNTTEAMQQRSRALQSVDSFNHLQYTTTQNVRMAPYFTTTQQIDRRQVKWGLVLEN